MMIDFPQDAVYVPGCSITIKLLLRRTLVLSVYSPATLSAVA